MEIFCVAVTYLNLNKKNNLSDFSFPKSQSIVLYKIFQVPNQIKRDPCKAPSFTKFRSQSSSNPRNTKSVFPRYQC